MLRKLSRFNIRFLCSSISWATFCLPCKKKKIFSYFYVIGCSFLWIWIPKEPRSLSPFPPPVASAALFFPPSHLDFLSLLTFWLCQPSLLYPPVLCLIIEVSVCLRGALQYLLIKASVCVCLFISGCYSRRSPGALMRHKAPLPTEAYTVSCHCTSSHSKHCQNEHVSFSTSAALSHVFGSLYRLHVHILICDMRISLSSGQSSRLMKAMPEVVSPSKFPPCPLLVSSSCFPLHTQSTYISRFFYVGSFPPVSPPHTCRVPKESSWCWKGAALTMITNTPLSWNTTSEEQQL